MDFISLFSGIGGFDLGLERAGMKCIAQVEIDKAARGVLATHYPHVERLNDVTKANKDNLPTASLICGGSPCQDISKAGHGEGLAGKRSRLFFEFARILRELRPEWFVFENVDNLLRTNDGRDFSAVIGALVGCGYSICWRVLDAQYWGVPQRRLRVFIVGHLRSAERAASILFEQESRRVDIGSGAAKREAHPRNTKSGIVALTGWDTQRRRIYDANGICPTLSAEDGRGQGVPCVFTGNAVRRLMPLEEERLQGFPDGWTFCSDGKPQSDTARTRQLGNAVAVPVVQWIGKRIMDANK